MTKNKKRKGNTGRMSPTGFATTPDVRTVLHAGHIEREELVWGVLPPQVSRALCNILDHYMADEKRDYDASEEKAPDTHIFLDLDLVDAWLRYIAGT